VVGGQWSVVSKSPSSYCSLGPHFHFILDLRSANNVFRWIRPNLVTTDY